jgi:hypothetical protein
MGQKNTHILLEAKGKTLSHTDGDIGIENENNFSSCIKV